MDYGSSSALITTESLRTLDRLRLRAGFGDTEIARRRSTIIALIESLKLIEIDATILARASKSMPTVLGSLDAVHLASALLWRETLHADPIMATHDTALGLAAQAHGFKVRGS